MQDLVIQEQFELEVLDKFNSNKFLKKLIFGGGTMLRLCFGLNRFSVDLDFWMVKDADEKELFSGINEYLGRFYTIRDATDKFHTLLFEIRPKDHPRSLKIEIRKKTRKVKTEQAIAYSPFANTQVFLTVVSLPDMMRSKIEAFLKRKEIRDVFDMEFLIKKGVKLDAPVESLKSVLKEMAAFTKQDYSVKLGSLLELDQRKYYLKENFKILRSAIQEKLAV
ncbi:MAG: hypothetical protein AUJ74_04575 [Candidatus Omnitrophica bacterium CG1_02_44_16]|nr:MAG: hypothetical protein AUJ74_04575 [Candidatus Omnitrophica bacterium CG1_02_44_16]